jgi:ribosomal protein S18 acetylase RimI-like enzyme
MIIYRDGETSDLNDLIHLHRSSGVQGILSKLTPRTLGEYYYLPALRSNSNIVKVAFNREIKKVVGLLIITPFPNAIPKPSINLAIKVAINIFLKSIVEPTLIVRIRNYFKCKSYLKKISLQRVQNAHELQMLIIDSNFQSHGIGHQLLNILENPILSNSLILVQTQDSRAQNYYQKFGFKIIQTFGMPKTSLFLLARKKPKTNAF